MVNESSQSCKAYKYDVRVASQLWREVLYIPGKAVLEFDLYPERRLISFSTCTKELSYQDTIIDILLTAKSESEEVLVRRNFKEFEISNKKLEALLRTGASFADSQESLGKLAAI